MILSDSQIIFFFIISVAVGYFLKGFVDKK